MTITGAAGNLGGLLADHLLDHSEDQLKLLIHHRDVPERFHQSERTDVIRGDLAEPESLRPALRNSDAVIHFAGVLFKARPEKFLPTTNTVYFENLCRIAIEEGVKRIILVSFPHVEGECTPVKPATGRLDGHPESAHARTRLEEEKHLFACAEGTDIEPVSLRVGMVYGKGILMVDAARWFAEHRLLGIWKKDTWIHLISTVDFLHATANALTRPDIRGIYHLGDDGQLTLQDFLDQACGVWKTRSPWRMPEWLIFLAARIFEWQSLLFGTRAPLTRDFIRIGMVSYYGDTTRMKQDLLPELKYPYFKDGLHTLR